MGKGAPYRQDAGKLPVCRALLPAREAGISSSLLWHFWKKSATQDAGEVYGINLIYSGNCMTLVDRGQFDNVRLMTGINPEGFAWQLNSGESFQAPEAVLVYSAEGLGGMSRNFHDLYRSHLIRGEYRDKKRPILINNWEATYFDFNEEKKKGKERNEQRINGSIGYLGERKGNKQGNLI